jgi:HEAT repeat protein
MEREVFPSPEVRAIAGDFLALKLNVDDRTYGDICRTWQPGSAVPSFVVLGADGSILDTWTGALDAEKFSIRLLRGKHLAKVPDAYRERWERAARRLSDGDVEPLRELIAVLENAGLKEWAKRLSLMECREHFYRYRWALCVEAADLTLRRYPGAKEAEILKARALFRGTGEIDPATRARVAALIAVLGHAYPRFGSEERQREWVREQNGAVDDLVAIGEPAVDALMEGLLEGDADSSQDCARALGRIRDSRVLPDLIAHLEDKRLRNPVRARVASAMKGWCDPAFLPVLVRFLDDRREAANVRVACAEAVARLGTSLGGLYGATVVEPLFRALGDRNKELRLACLQALYSVKDNFDLARLFDAMGDDRFGIMYTVGDSACDLFLTRAGYRAQLPDGTPLPEDFGFPRGTDLFLRNWWLSHASTLVWDPDETRYYVRSE